MAGDIYAHSAEAGWFCLERIIYYTSNAKFYMKLPHIQKGHVQLENYHFHLPRGESIYIILISIMIFNPIKPVLSTIKCPLC